MKKNNLLDYEIIFMDNHSSDRSPVILEKMAADDKRIKKGENDDIEQSAVSKNLVVVVAVIFLP